MPEHAPPQPVKFESALGTAVRVTSVPALYPAEQVAPQSMPAGVDMFRKNKGKPGEVTVTDEDARIINEVLTPFWAGKDYATNFIRSLPEETRFMMYGPDPKNTIMMTIVVMASSPMRHSQNWTPDFNKILTARQWGTFSVCATIKGVEGCLNGEVPRQK